MTDRPILFSAPMVRALLDGRKTQTRRIMKVQPPKEEDFGGSVFGLCPAVADGVKMHSLNQYKNLPKHPTKWDLDGSVGVARRAGFPMEYDARFAIGDRLWVKETWRAHRAYDQYRPGLIGTESRIWYEADGRDNCDQHGKGRPSIFMPRWASRLTLVVTDVRVERLHKISEADAQAEGVDRLVMYDSGAFYAGFPEGTYRCGFAGIWSHINSAEAWEANPWVVAVSFDVIKENIDG
ncbi:hypothetical protein [Sphingobium yanoikuyae]|uniref:Morphogenetic protein n=1 Tax=Sphingobium yanoikuyae TaxID=13690 RepID=A0A3G2V798_SPHYA|nr:hypothetical protein [Sphingobium yanoikuyae]AYO80141.1 hypothetical protein EBF16_26695 [Sphingobium yanoikuyae]